MSTTETLTAAHRPALLVGYGAFGLDVLRRLLASTAPRGVLRWQEPAGGASAGERYLQDLALLWVPDRWDVEGQQVDDEDRHEGASLEMMRDLYRQIERVAQHSTPEADLAAAMNASAEKLLSASARAGRDQVSPLGLDVIVLVRPTRPEALGFLDRMLAEGMERLANNANLVRAVQGSEALSFLEILDFENYWDHSPEGRRIREAVAGSIDRWQRCRAERQPAFGRFYFVDGRTHDGIRDVRHRLDEISLFLELLLFEGQRGTLQHLYQSPGIHESPVATFGIRLMERSAGLLSRLAAGRFGIGWLDYLAGAGTSLEDGGETLELRRRLGPYRPANLDDFLGRQALEELLGDEVRTLEAELVTFAPEDPAWSERVRRRYQEKAGELRDLLSAEVSTRMAEIRREHLAAFADELRTGIEADLHNPRRPVPLGTVLKTVEEVHDELDAFGSQASGDSGEAVEPFRELERLHARYRTFHDQRIDVEGLKKWWLIFALVLAAALTPIGVELLDDVPKPDPTRFLLTKAWEAVQWIKNPAAVGGLAFLACWAVGGWALQRRIAARVDRGRRFYKHPQRGRFVDRLRSDLAPGGVLRAPLEGFLDALLQNLSLSLRTEARRELARVLGRLRERRREMLWLREQLREFLRIQGLSIDDHRHQLRRRQGGTGIRHSVERDEDFEQMLKSNPPSPERFRSTQASLDPFVGWDERYGKNFLYPLAFIDRLSTIYRDPFQRELAQPGSGPEQERRAREFLDFLSRHGAFDLAFHWDAQEGVPTDRRTCLLPAIWRQLPGVLNQLTDLRVSEENVRVGGDVARAYLLRVQTGVDPKCLLEAR